ncbi:bromodomain and WD repeat-containing protein 1 isoform X1 [Sesbania bispinosa]|nr:bromodomain and WD repeat-containing protein 1 isoform X1 [Sesbania bispinosa]
MPQPLFLLSRFFSSQSRVLATSPSVGPHRSRPLREHSRPRRPQPRKSKSFPRRPLHQRREQKLWSTVRGIPSSADFPFPLCRVSHGSLMISA